VTREEILERIWGKGVFIEGESSINAAVRKIRRALNDDREAPRFVVTVPSRGYRFEALIRAARGTSTQSRLPQGAFIGRNIEMAELSAGLADAAAGLGRLFLISGQPGIGKTRMARELAATAEASGMRVLAGQCSEHDEAVPYLPFVEVLESYVERVSGPDVLRTVLGEEGPELARLLPKLNRILPDLPPPLELPPQQARRHMFNCFCDFVARVATEQTTLLILEDLHWADDSTLALLGHLTQRLSRLPLLVAGTYRDVELNVAGELARTLENLLRGRLATALTLTGLRREEVAEMLSSLSGQAPPAAIAAEFYRETEGNPFFVEELFRHLEEESRLYNSDGIFNTDLRIAELEVPRSVRLVVGRRLARLSDRTQGTLGTAATIGRLFSLELIEASTKAEASSLLESVEEAERAGLVFSSAESPTARFEFSHELVRQAVVGGLSAARRQRLHLEVAEAIERVYAHALEDHYGDLAHHYSRSDNVAKAVEYLGRAGQQAIRRSAYAEAIGSLSTALDLLQRLPKSPEGIQQELLFQLALGPALINVKGRAAPETERAYTRALELCERMGDPPELFRALYGLWVVHLYRGEVRKAHERAEQLLRLAQGAPDPLLSLHAHQASGNTSLSMGAFLPAREHLEMAISLYDHERHRSLKFRYVGAGAGVACLSLAAWTLWLLGYPDQALKRGNEALAFAQTLSDPFCLVLAEYDFGALRQYRREAVAAQETEESVIALCAEHGFPDWLAQATTLRGWAMAEQGHNEEGIAQVQEGLAAYRATGAELMRPYFLMLLGDACRDTNRLDHGLIALTEALAAANEHENRQFEAETHRLKGDLLLKQSDSNAPEARSCFERAIEIARKQSAKSWELRATMSLARLLATQGHCGEARTMLADIYGWFTEGFDTADLKQAKALLDELGAS
jgi:predicted ATPase